MLACFFQGLTCFLLASTSRSLQIFLRVVAGSMMSSTKPKNKHLASQRRVCNVLYCCIQFEQTQIRAFRESCKKCDIVHLWQQLGRGWRTSPRIPPLPPPGSPFLWRWSAQRPEKETDDTHCQIKKERKRKRKKEIQTEKHVCLYLGTHDSNLSWGPGVVHISSQVFGAHHVIRSSVSLGYTHTHTHHLFDPFYSLKDVLNFMFKSKHSYKSKVHFSLRGCTKTTFKSWSYFFNLYSDNFIYILFNWTAQVKISKTSKDFQYHFDHTHLSGDDSYFRDSGLSKCIQQFGSVSDDASVLLSGTCWQQSH